MDADQQERVATLRSIPLFASCPQDDLAAIAASLVPEEAASGDTIFREGDPGDVMYIISTGRVRIVATARAQEAIAELGPGDFFGEMALITGLPRSAGAVATADARLWRLEKEPFDRLIRTYPPLSIEMSRILSGRVRRATPVGRDLAGRTAIVTGASKGIGVEIARALAREGCNVVLTARSADKLEEVRREIEAMGVRALAIPMDVGNRADLQALVVRTITEFGAIDLLVNNAGLLLTLAYQKVHPHEIDEMVRVNLTGPMFLSWLVLPGMLERGAGHIVNIASVAGKYGPPFNEIYAATKAGLMGFSQSFRASYRDAGVSASVVCPGFVKSGMYARTQRAGLKAPRALGTTTPDLVAAAVVRAVKQDLPEIMVSPGLVRLLMALPTLLPGVAEWGRRKIGTDDLYRKAAEIKAQRRAEAAG
jgi:short-subunit dehydrogenase